jgi:hypothetical protein
MNEGSFSPIAGNGTELATSAKHLLSTGKRTPGKDSGMGCSRQDRLTWRGEIKLQSLTPEAIDVIAVQVIGRRISLTSDDLAMATEPERMIGARGGPGGTAPGRVLDMITECRARLIRENL